MKRNGSDRINEPTWTKNVQVHNLALVVLFIMCLFANAPEPRSSTQHDSLDQTYLTRVDSNSQPCHGQKLPFGSNSSLPGETPSENELEEEIDSDEDDKEYAYLHIPGNIAHISRQTSWLQCVKAFKNHQTVSLFILYHSWKSYLS